MHNKNKVIFDKKLPYKYNICLYILEGLCDKGVIDVFEMTEAIILRKKHKMPVISIYGKKGNNSIHYKAVARKHSSEVSELKLKQSNSRKDSTRIHGIAINICSFLNILKRRIFYITNTTINPSASIWYVKQM